MKLNMEQLPGEKQLMKIFSVKENELKKYFKKNKSDLKVRETLLNREITAMSNTNKPA
jgi:hypothetical protein